MTFDPNDLRRAMKAIESEYRTPQPRIVSPAKYAQRAECPLWTNRPNERHQHNALCTGWGD